ncbi:hypothetical protein APE01nite_20660 [Acetobacter peroxydans]|uniref:Uncharacterized protein n=1 Tax=Acetobacter peroxydans TaxID=104098 RepID=A0A4Y3TXU1_9PROT|nr:hypothetical protein AA13755_2235 [Acetobacter peroxydans NBRC 13755]GBR39532.1 hypothetical protein AA0475_0233 [Acetobacter peroxydans]GEB86269.1 hypothetical protein APE01nite_20660 [Acetobacter peroxydans]
MQVLVDEIVARALPLIHVEREAEQLDTQEAYEAFRVLKIDLCRHKHKTLWATRSKIMPLFRNRMFLRLALYLQSLEVFICG